MQKITLRSSKLPNYLITIALLGLVLSPLNPIGYTLLATPAFAQSFGGDRPIITLELQAIPEAGAAYSPGMEGEKASVGQTGEKGNYAKIQSQIAATKDSVNNLKIIPGLTFDSVSLQYFDAFTKNLSSASKTMDDLVATDQKNSATQAILIHEANKYTDKVAEQLEALKPAIIETTTKNFVNILKAAVVTAIVSSENISDEAKDDATKKIKETVMASAVDLEEVVDRATNSEDKDKNQNALSLAVEEIISKATAAATKDQTSEDKTATVVALAIVSQNLDVQTTTATTAAATAAVANVVSAANTAAAATKDAATSTAVTATTAAKTGEAVVKAIADDLANRDQDKTDKTGKATATVGQSVTISLNFTKNGNEPAANATVKVEITKPNGRTSVEETKTDKEGNASVSYTPIVPGNYAVSATATDENNNFATRTQSFFAKEQGTINPNQALASLSGDKAAQEAFKALQVQTIPSPATLAAAFAFPSNTQNWSMAPNQTLDLMSVLRELIKQMGVDLFVSLAQGSLLTWTSSDLAVASINAAGLATANAPGAATVTATLTDKEGNPHTTTTNIVVVKDFKAAVTVGTSAVSWQTSTGGSVDAFYVAIEKTDPDTNKTTTETKKYSANTSGLVELEEELSDSSTSAYYLGAISRDETTGQETMTTEPIALVTKKINEESTYTLIMWSSGQDLKDKNENKETPVELMLKLFLSANAAGTGVQNFVARSLFSRFIDWLKNPYNNWFAYWFLSKGFYFDFMNLFTVRSRQAKCNCDPNTFPPTRCVGAPLSTEEYKNNPQKEQKEYPEYFQFCKSDENCEPPLGGTLTSCPSSYAATSGAGGAQYSPEATNKTSTETRCSGKAILVPYKENIDLSYGEGASRDQAKKSLYQKLGSAYCKGTCKKGDCRPNEQGLYGAVTCEEVENQGSYFYRCYSRSGEELKVECVCMGK